MMDRNEIEAILSYGGPRDATTRKLAESHLSALDEIERQPSRLRNDKPQLTIPIYLSMDEISQISDASMIGMDKVVEIIAEMERVLKERNASRSS